MMMVRTFAKPGALLQLDSDRRSALSSSRRATLRSPRGPREEFYAMTAQASGDVREDDVTVVEFDRKGRAWKNLLDAPEHFERRFLDVFRDLSLGWPWAGPAAPITNRDGSHSSSSERTRDQARG